MSEGVSEVVSSDPGVSERVSKVVSQVVSAFFVCSGKCPSECRSFLFFVLALGNRNRCVEGVCLSADLGLWTLASHIRVSTNNLDALG